MPINNVIPSTSGKRRRGNPNWSRGFGLDDAPQPSSFEKLLANLGMNLSQSCDQLAAHPKVKQFVRKYVRSRFIPEGLLKLLGLEEAGDL